MIKDDTTANDDDTDDNIFSAIDEDDRMKEANARARAQADGLGLQVAYNMYPFAELTLLVCE